MWQAHTRFRSGARALYLSLSLSFSFSLSLSHKHTLSKRKGTKQMQSRQGVDTKGTQKGQLLRDHYIQPG